MYSILFTAILIIRPWLNITCHMKEDFHMGFSFASRSTVVWWSGQLLKQMWCRDPIYWICWECHLASPLKQIQIVSDQHTSLNFLFHVKIIHYLRGVSSDTIMAIGPLNPPQPFTSSELISWKDHQSETPRFKMISALTPFACKNQLLGQISLVGYKLEDEMQK